MSRVSVAEPPEDPEGWEELETIARGLPQGQWFEGKPWNQGGCGAFGVVSPALVWSGAGRLAATRRALSTRLNRSLMLEQGKPWKGDELE